MSERQSNDTSSSIITRSLSWVDDPKKVKRFFWGLVAAGAVLTVVDLLYKKKVYFEIEYHLRLLFSLRLLHVRRARRGRTGYAVHADAT